MAHVTTENGVTYLRDDWHIEDVQVGNEWITDEQAIDVLEHVARNHDSEVGINWEVINFWAYELYPEPDAVA